MNTLLKGVLLTSLGVAAISTAQAQYNPGDLFIGFTGGTTSDVLFDIGTPASLGIGGPQNHTTDISSSINFSLLSANGYGTLAGNSFGVVGYQNTPSKGIYSSTPHGFSVSSIPNQSAFNGISLTIDNTGPFIDGTGNPANSAVVSKSDPNSWNMNMANPGANTFFNDYGNPDVTITGNNDVADLYLAKADGSAPQLVGGFDLNGNTLTFTTVPEPSTTALVTVAGLMALAFGRYFRRKA